MEITTAFIGAAGIIVGVITTQLFNHFRGRKEIKEQSIYLSARCSCSLHKFVSMCGEIVSDCLLPIHMRSDNPRQIPKLDLPDDANWKSIDPELMYSILTIPGQVADIENKAKFLEEYVANPPDYKEITQHLTLEYSRLACNCIETAELLERHFKATPLVSNKQFFEENIKKIEADNTTSLQLPSTSIKKFIKANTSAPIQG